VPSSYKLVAGHFFYPFFLVASEWILVGLKGKRTVLKFISRKNLGNIVERLELILLYYIITRKTLALSNKMGKLNKSCVTGISLC